MREQAQICGIKAADLAVRLLATPTKFLCFRMLQEKGGGKSFLLYRYNPTVETDKVVYQVHEWMTGMGRLYIQEVMCRKLVRIFTDLMQHRSAVP